MPFGPIDATFCFVIASVFLYLSSFIPSEKELSCEHRSLASPVSEHLDWAA
jgi:hypothetical protein